MCRRGVPLSARGVQGPAPESLYICFLEIAKSGLIYWVCLSHALPAAQGTLMSPPV